MASVIRVTDAETLIKTSEYPYAHWPFEEFNPIQSALVPHCNDNTNVVVAAATSSGKTLVAELYIADVIRRLGQKAIYIGPMKALAKEKLDDWTMPDHHFKDCNIAICTGDFRLTQSRVNEMDKADVIVMTPEMLASRLRNCKSEKSSFLQKVGVVAFDESHLLTVPSRGDHIEVALMKMVEINPNVRIVLLSATMPNVDELAEWICELTGRDTVLLESSYRPCPLAIHYETYYDGDRKYEQKEIQKVGTAAGLVNYYPDDKFLIFVHTKRTGRLMKETLAENGIDAEFHNADLDLSKRLSLEKRFKEDPQCRVVIATSTLAWGCYRHGSKLIGKNGELIEASQIRSGTILLSPVGSTFEEKRVIRSETFHKPTGYFVRLESGERMVVSPEHIFLAAAKRLPPGWVSVQELSVGDFVGTPSDLNLCSEKQPFDRFWYLTGFAFGDGSLTSAGKHADGHQKAVLDLCLGCYNEHAEIITNLFNEEFNGSYNPRDDVNGVPHIISKRRDIVDAFLPLLPLGRKNGKSLPPKEIYGNFVRIVNFLQGWFDADGGVEKHTDSNSSVGLTCISRTAIESARTQLLGFGIHSSFGRKRMKDRIINGRLQKAARKWIYRLRIFGYQNLSNFQRFIGFSHPDKRKALAEYLELISLDKSCKDVVPARELINEHIVKNGIKRTTLRKQFGIDLWNALNKQDCTRQTLKRLVANATHRTGLNDLLEFPIYWSRIAEIHPCAGGAFQEIEVEEPHAYVGNGAISHNCNLPARRVIIVGIHRGISLVENYDIWQEVGRAGRPKYDPRGDAYILVPESGKSEAIWRLNRKTRIMSQLLENISGHHKTLAFHVVSEIHHGGIRTREGFHEWFRKSLAHFQDHDFDDKVIDEVIDMLVKSKAITIEEDEYKVAPVGIVASMFYYSPFDVADLRKNFAELFDRGHENENYAVAGALANIDSYRVGIVNKSERAEMVEFQAEFEKRYGLGKLTDAAMKTAFGYHNLLTGKHNETMNSLQSSLRLDLDRTMEVMGAVDSMAAKWDKANYFKTLRQKLVYGVGEEALDLCQIPSIGKARSERLLTVGIKTLDQFCDADPINLAAVMKIKNQTQVDQMIAAAKLVRLKKQLLL